MINENNLFISFLLIEEYLVPDSRNVIARIIGSDESLKDQSILVNAHYGK